MKDIFCESNGRLSSMRVMSFIALFVAAFITIKGVFSIGVQLDILIVWITGAFAPKVVQKFAEKNIGNAG